MKTKLLLTILLISCLALSTYGQIPYEYFSGRSEEADGEIPAAKIPNCVHQRGYKCYACGPDTSGETPVVLIPNSNQRCVPAGQSGCNRFADAQGQFCDLDNGCACKFAIDSTKRTCVSTAQVPNCFIFDKDNETCLQCVGYGRVYQYYGPYETALSGNKNQPIPSGGGINDYGLSSDSQSCLDNIANGNPHCLKYATPTSCSTCDSGYQLIQTGTPGSPLRKCQKLPTSISGCYVYTPDGTRCLSCSGNSSLSQTGTCVAPTFSAAGKLFEDANCVRWFKNDDGTGNSLQCAQCVNYSYLLEFGRCSQLITSFEKETLNYLTGQFDLPQLDPFCRIGYMSTFQDQHHGSGFNTDGNFFFCMVKKTANDFYNPVVAPATPAPVLYPRADLNCDDFNQSTGMCNTCASSYYLNTQTGECFGQTSGSCQLTGCLTAEGLSYCTQCDLQYDLVDGHCMIQTFSTDTDTQKYCIKFRPDGQCDGCEATYFLDTTGADPVCKRKYSLANCSTWLNGECTACKDLGKVPVNGACVWDANSADNLQKGGVPGCLTHSEDGVCTAAYDNIFLIKDLNDQYTKTKYIGLCAVYTDNGDCTLCNHIRASLVKNLSTGLYQCSILNGGNSMCDKSENDGCTRCASCKTTWTLSGGDCPLNLVAGQTATYVQPESVIRGCIKMASATTCEQCRNPDFILTGDNQCYDLNHKRLNPTTSSWVSLFQYNDGTAYNAPDLYDYDVSYYEPCEKATDIYTCSQSFGNDKDNIFLVTVDGTALFTKAAIVYSHYNKNADFDKSTSGLIVNQVAADITALVLTRVEGCTAYTSLLAGTCNTCKSDRTKQSDNLQCYFTNGSHNTDNLDQNCQTVDATTGKCNTCDTTVYIYDATLFRCRAKSTTISKCVGSDYDTTTYQCKTRCIAGYQFTGLATLGQECFSIRQSSNYNIGFTLGSNIGCNTSICSIKSTTFTAGVAATSNDVLKIASCSRGFTLTNNQCILKQEDWQTTVAEVFATSGKIQACQPGYTYVSGNSCSKVVANCQTPSVGTCANCQTRTDNKEGITYFRVNSGKLCIPPSAYIKNCVLYNDSGIGCRRCDGGFEGFEDKGCVLPPRCTSVDRVTLRCTDCQSNFVVDATGHCIPLVPSTFAADGNCQTAYNSSHCAECVGGTVLAIDDLTNDNLYGVGQCVSKTFNNQRCTVDTNCELVLRTPDQENCFNTVLECIRCAWGTALFGGKCYPVDDKLEYVPYGCVNIEFDEDQKAFVCTECDFGFALTADRKYCVRTTGQCSYLDSTECAFYEKAVGQEEVHIQCAEARSDSNAAVLSAVLMIILNIVLFNI